MSLRRSLSVPIVLAVVMIVLLVALTVGLVIAVIGRSRARSSGRLLGPAGRWLDVHSVVVGGVVLYLILSIKAINLTRRQSNFIDSVTHELKSPIASMKLTCKRSIAIR